MLRRAGCCLRGYLPGVTAVYAACVYGYPENPNATVNMVESLMEHLSQWQDHCCVIGGDLNLQIEEGWLDMLLGNAGWHDGMVAGAKDGLAQATCFSGHEHRRIDHLLLNTIALRRVQEAACIIDADTHPHAPIFCRLFGEERQAQTRVAIPPAAKLRQGREEAAEQWLATQASRWSTLLELEVARGTADSMILCFSRKWEAYLRSVHDDTLQGGRGRLGETHNADRPKERKRKPGGEHEAQMLLGLAKHSHRTGTKEHWQEMQRLWSKNTRWATLIPEWHWSERLCEQPAELVRLCAALKVAVVKEEQKRRREEWREKLAAADLRDLCNILRKPIAPPLGMLKDGENWTSHPDRILELIRQEWAPIMEADTPALMEIDDYLAELPSESFSLPEITALQLQDAAKRMRSRSVAGADGWRVAELKAMPQQFYSDLALVMNRIEQADMGWPTSLARAWIAAIPKTRREASDIRPIAVLPVLHRLWSSARGSLLRDWLHRLQPECQCAYRTGRSVEDEVAVLGAYYERHAARGTAIATVGLDFSKAFDTVRHQTLGCILQRLGMTEGTWQLLQKATLQH